MSAKKADLVLRHGLIHRIGAEPLVDGAVAIADDRILFVGPDAELEPFLGRKSEEIELDGRPVLPGFHDAHIHPLIGALDLVECSLHGLTSREAYLEKIRSYASANRDRPFIRGAGWIYSTFPNSGPRKEDLDAIVSDRPLFLKALDGHSGWVNSVALRQAGIGRETPDPSGGVIERDPVTGEPTGALREWPAMGMVTDLLAKPSAADWLTGARLFQKQAARFGITSINEAVGKPHFLDAWKTLEDADELTVRIRAGIFGAPNEGPGQVAGFPERIAAFTGPMLCVGPVKLFLDGVVEGRTAWLLEEYADRSGSFGEPIWEPSAFNEVVAAIDKAGLQIHVHAVGDRAVRVGLDAVEFARKVNGPRDARHMIAHADLISESDIPRFARLGVVPNLQSAWFAKDSNYERVTVPLLGRKRAENLYKIRSLARAEARIAISSDWPFGGDRITFNPLDSIQTAVTRRGIGSEDLDAWMPEEGVSVREMIDWHTLGSAYADFADHERGSLEAGKLADLIVLDRDIYAGPVEQLHQARVLMTLVGGRQVWPDPEG